jgi:hypothetical protein
LRLGIAAHLDEAKTLGAAGVALHHDLGAGHLTVLAEGLLEIAIAHGIRKIADVQLVAHLRDS